MGLQKKARALSDDDRNFITQLVKDHFGLICKYSTVAPPNPTHSEDIRSVAYIRLMENVHTIRKLDDVKLVRSYVVKTTTTARATFMEKEKRLYEALLDDDEGLKELASFLSTEEEALLQVEIAEMYEEIRHLAPALYQALEWKYLFNVSDKEIAERLNVSVDSVRQYLTRARREARERLERRYKGQNKPN